MHYIHLTCFKKPAKSKKPCTFFNSMMGCKYGDRCRFSHIKDDSIVTSKYFITKINMCCVLYFSPRSQSRQIPPWISFHFWITIFLSFSSLFCFQRAKNEVTLLFYCDSQRICRLFELMKIQKSIGSLRTEILQCVG